MADVAPQTVYVPKAVMGGGRAPAPRPKAKRAPPLAAMGKRPANAPGPAQMAMLLAALQRQGGK